MSQPAVATDTTATSVEHVLVARVGGEEASELFRGSEEQMLALRCALVAAAKQRLEETRELASTRPATREAFNASVDALLGFSNDELAYMSSAQYGRLAVLLRDSRRHLDAPMFTHADALVAGLERCAASQRSVIDRQRVPAGSSLRLRRQQQQLP